MLTIIQMIIVVVMLMMLVVMVMILAVMVVILVVMVVMLMVLVVVLSILTRHPSPHESVSGWVCPAASSRNQGGLFFSQELERDYSSHNPRVKPAPLVKPSSRTAP